MKIRHGKKKKQEQMKNSTQQIIEDELPSGPD